MSGRAGAPRLAGLLLAAGRSRRMAGGNKLVRPLGGVPLVRRTAAVLCEAGLDPVIAVTGYGATAVEAALAGLPVGTLRNPGFAKGMGTSLARGVGALPSGLSGVVIALADMPRVKPAHIARLVAAFDPAHGAAICVPVFRGARGHPVLFAARFFAELRALDGDRGARTVISRHAASLCEVEIPDCGVLFDIDTEADWADSARWF